ncbi:MAG: hypothetical protein SFV81_03055, partial [Pirellulaceae bacterium]|nr:hypothetical protein [Pirellulaceae bacterium]
PMSYPDRGTHRLGNRHYRIADLIRASTAAPSYFRPHKIQIHEDPKATDADGIFVDGGISPYNDPSLLLFMMAGIRGYRMGGVQTYIDKDGVEKERGIPWKLGDDQLLIISVGTGDYRVTTRSSRWKPAIMFAGKSLLGMTSDAQSLSLQMMQWLANPKKAWTVNSEIDDLRDDHLGELIGAPGRFLSFARYNVKLEQKWINDKLGMKFSKWRLRRLQKIDSPPQIEHYLNLGRQAAAYQVTPDDFPAAFDTEPAFAGANSTAKSAPTTPQWHPHCDGS